MTSHDVMIHHVIISSSFTDSYREARVSGNTLLHTLSIFRVLGSLCDKSTCVMYVSHSIPQSQCEVSDIPLPDTSDGKLLDLLSSVCVLICYHRDVYYAQ